MSIGEHWCADGVVDWVGSAADGLIDSICQVFELRGTDTASVVIAAVGKEFSLDDVLGLIKKHLSVCGHYFAR